MNKKPYIHTNVEICLSAKKPGTVCGDVIEVLRDANSTTIILCDGLGSGLKANIYATMIAGRIKQSLLEGVSIQKCFQLIGKTMNAAWGKDDAFAVFSICRIFNNGSGSVYCYDTPAPVFVSAQYAEVLESRTWFWEKAKITEAGFKLKNNEGILLMSDGITQAGLGNGLNYGWESEGVARYISSNKHLANRDFKNLASDVHKQAQSLWGRKYGDDCSLALAYNRRGITLNLITGTPINEADDTHFVNDFYSTEGIKVVCGGSTSKMVARELKKRIEILEEGTFITPPSYKIQGITIATEGLVTLNQLYNLLSEDIDYEEGNIVLELADLMKNADRILFWVGKAKNKGNNMLEIKQQGLLNRLKIVEMISEKLRESGKTVIVKNR